MSPTISNLQRIKESGDYEDLLFNPYINGDEEIYFDMSDNEKLHWAYKFLPDGSEVHIEPMQQNGRWKFTFPAESLAEGLYKIVGHTEDVSHNSTEINELVIVDKTSPDLDDLGYGFDLFYLFLKDAAAVQHSSDATIYFFHKDCAHFAIDEARSHWDFKKQGDPGFLPLPWIGYENWCTPTIKGKRIGKFNFPVRTNPLDEDSIYEIKGTLVDKAGNSNEVFRQLKTGTWSK